MSVMQIYERPVALDRNVHQEIRINQEQNYLFASKCQTAILVAAELNQALKEFPIVFIKENDSFLPTAVLGLQQNQNLFVDESGNWTARYTPAFIRRYPFVPAIGEKDDDLMTVCIDEAAVCVNREKGEPLFLDGKNSTLLENTIQFLQNYKTQTDDTLILIKQLVNAELLSEKAANIKLNDGKSFSLSGFYTVDAEKLSKLSAEISFKLFQSGALHLAYLHLSSLDNWDRLISLQTEVERSKLEAENSKNKQIETVA
jgi:hypothetical protein